MGGTGLVWGGKWEVLCVWGGLGCFHGPMKGRCGSFHFSTQVLMNPGQVGLGSSRPESSRPGQLGRVKSALYIRYSMLCIRRDVPVGVPLDLFTPTGMSCIGTYGEHCKSDNVSKYRVLLAAFLLLWHEN